MDRGSGHTTPITITTCPPPQPVHLTFPTYPYLPQLRYMLYTLPYPTHYQPSHSYPPTLLHAPATLPPPSLLPYPAHIAVVTTPPITPPQPFPRPRTFAQHDMYRLPAFRWRVVPPRGRRSQRWYAGTTKLTGCLAFRCLSPTTYNVPPDKTCGKLRHRYHAALTLLCAALPERIFVAFLTGLTAALTAVPCLCLPWRR